MRRRPCINRPTRSAMLRKMKYAVVGYEEDSRVDVRLVPSKVDLFDTILVRRMTGGRKLFHAIILELGDQQEMWKAYNQLIDMAKNKYRPRPGDKRDFY